MKKFNPRIQYFSFSKSNDHGDAVLAWRGLEIEAGTCKSTGPGIVHRSVMSLTNKIYFLYSLQLEVRVMLIESDYDCSLFIDADSTALSKRSRFLGRFSRAV